MDDAIPALKNLCRKIIGELRQFAILSLYLYICFGAVLLYTAAVLRAHGVAYAPYGFAVIKSLIMAKFILIGDSLEIGDIHRRRGRLIYAILYKSVVYLIFLVILSVIEEIAAGLIHGRSVTASLSDMGGGTGLQILATCFLIWLILLPIVGLQQITNVLGSGVLHRMFFAAD